MISLLELSQFWIFIGEGLKQSDLILIKLTTTDGKNLSRNLFKTGLILKPYVIFFLETRSNQFQKNGP